MGRDSWPVPPPPNWRPPRWDEQRKWFVGLVAAVTLVTDVLIAVAVTYRPWGEQMQWSRQMLLCAATPLNLTALWGGLWWLSRRTRG